MRDAADIGNHDKEHGPQGEAVRANMGVRRGLRGLLY